MASPCQIESNFPPKFAKKGTSRKFAVGFIFNEKKKFLGYTDTPSESFESDGREIRSVP